MEQVNINITNNFGNENIEYITEEYLTKLIQNGIFGSIPKLMKQIHFNGFLCGFVWVFVWVFEWVFVWVGVCVGF